MGTEPLDGGPDVVVVGVVVVEVEVVVVVVVDDVGGGGVVVVVADVDADDMSKPQPRDGSFSARGSDTGNSDATGGPVVVVVLVEVLVVSPVPVLEELVVVDVGGAVVVEFVGAATLSFDDSSTEPVMTSATSRTARTVRSSQRRWGGTFGELVISSHGNSGERECCKRNRNVIFVCHHVLVELLVPVTARSSRRAKDS